MASGILAVCLPVSPKFFQGLKTSRLGTFLRSLLHGKSEAGLNLSIRSGERQTAKGHHKATFRKYRFLSDEVSTSKNDSNEQDMPTEYSLGELSTKQILSTTQIVTSERDAASIGDLGNEASNV